MFLSHHNLRLAKHMSNENEEFPNEESSPGREDFMAFMSEFLTSAKNSEKKYCDNYCDIVVNKVFNDFGYEGLCNLMMAIDKRANWISDILIENSDLDDILFKKYGLYDDEICLKARKTQAMIEMNGKIWSLRRKYARAIVAELHSDIENDGAVK